MADVLGIEHIEEHQNFFSLGGNSLAMIEVISQTQRTLSIRFDPNPVIDTFFGAGTLRALIERIESLVDDSRAVRAEHGT
jgi:acyl carrier protein